MRLRSLAMAACLALAPLAALGQAAPRQAAPAPPPPREREATIANQSGQTLRELYAAPPGGEAFGPDLLGADTVPDRGNFRARIPGSECVLEFRAVFQDGTEERRRQNICQNRRVQFGDPAIPLREATMSSPNHHRSKSAVVGVTSSSRSAAPCSRPRQSCWVRAVRLLARAMGDSSRIGSSRLRC